MYTDALEYLEEEHDAWAPFEALDRLSDEALSRPTDPAGPGHGWSGRTLMAHLVFWQAVALQIAKELALGETSPTRERTEAAWRERGEAFNDEPLAEAEALPLEVIRRRFRTVAGELRGYLTVVPETRWLKHSRHLATFLGETSEHYQEHLPELTAILAQAGKEP